MNFLRSKGAVQGANPSLWHIHVPCSENRLCAILSSILSYMPLYSLSNFVLSWFLITRSEIEFQTMGNCPQLGARGPG